ncbi:RDD family protein [Streptomyces cinerochromogenes]|uniref:RDD family protein n=1 Tax=Streptomyces cinerochromogenes TaxID=66422 RepID=UPI0033B23A45
MSAPTPAPGDDRPREGYYPDPSIPGYVRYWNGASWVPGTSRPAPKDGEPLTPPPGVRPAPAAVEETGPHFFDEDPPGPDQQAGPDRQGGAGPQSIAGQRGAEGQQGAAGQAAGQWSQAGPAAQAGPADQWAQAGPAGQAAQAGAAAQGGPAAQGAQWSRPGQAAQPGQPGQPGQSGQPGQPGGAARWGGAGQSGQAAQQGQSGQPAQPGQPGHLGQPGESGRPGEPALPAQSRQGAGGWGADPRVPVQAPGPADGQATSRTDGTATIPPAEDEAPDPGTFVFRRPIPGPAAAARTDDGTMTIRPVPSGPESGGPAGFGTQGPVGVPANSGFAAGKAAAARAAAAPTPASPPAPQPSPAAPAAAAPSVPQQAAAPATPLTSGPGGGQASWAQQVHQLAGGGDEQPVAPWKPPVEDFFQAAARRQAAARPAGLGRRLAARLIDLLAIGAITAAAAVPLGIRAVDHVQQKIDAARESGHEVTVWLLDGTTGTGLGIVLAVLLVAGVLYEVLPTVKWGRTLGKKLCGLEVRDIEAHEPPTFGPALRRWLVFSVPGLLVVGIVGVLWCLFDRPWRQCWHDKAARTFVAG